MSEDKCTEHRVKIEKIEKDLYDNGQKGIKTIVTESKVKIESLVWQTRMILGVLAIQTIAIIYKYIAG